MAVNAIGDAPLVKGESRRGLSLWAKQVQLGSTANGGGSALTQQTPFSTCIAAMATISAVAPLGAAGAVVVAAVNPANPSQVLLERYQADSSATPAWVDSTTDLLVNLIVVGYE